MPVAVLEEEESMTLCMESDNIMVQKYRLKECMEMRKTKCLSL